MKTFGDLKFKPLEIGGVRATMTFDNGYGVSVIKTPYSYGGDKGLYEMAILGLDGDIVYDTPITNDVLGHLTEDDVSHYMVKVQKLLTYKLF